MFDLLLTRAEKNNITKWTYHVEDKSITTKLFTPFWNYIVAFVPPIVAPNVLSLAGLLCIIYAYYLSHIISSPYYTLMCFCVFALTFAYMTLDAIDGKHARKTGNASPLGELFDHVCDAIGTTFMVLTGCNILGIYNSNYLWHIVQTGGLIFLSEHINAYATKKVTFGKYTGPGEALIVYFVVILLCAFNPTLPGFVYYSALYYFDLIQVSAYVTSNLCVIIYYLVLCKVIKKILFLGKENQSSINGLCISLLIKAIPAIVVYFGLFNTNHSIFNIIADGTFMAIITSDMIVAKMSNRDLHPWIVIFTMISAFDSFLSIVLTSFYTCTIMYEISTYLNIYILLPDINILCLGVFDMCHLGHMKMFQNAAKLGTKLYVGVHSDADVESYKCKPTMTMEERMAVVSHCKGVSTVLSDAPLYPTEEYIKKYNIHKVVCDPEYFTPTDEYYEAPRNLNILHPLPRTQGMSSSVLRKRMYDRVRSNEKPGKLENEDNIK